MTGPTAKQRQEGRSWIWGSVRNAAGETVTRSFATAEGYALTARTAVESLLRVQSGAVAPGAWTPARAFGAHFIAGFDSDEATPPATHQA